MSPQVSDTGFQDTDPRSADGALGMPRLVRYPVTATITTMTESTSDTLPLLSPAVAPPMMPPAMVPSRMATRVPISTMALPPTSSVLCRCWGRIANLSGPKKVDCTPSRKTTASSAVTFCTYSASAAQMATAISPSLT